MAFGYYDNEGDNPDWPACAGFNTDTALDTHILLDYDGDRKAFRDHIHYLTHNAAYVFAYVKAVYMWLYNRLRLNGAGSWLTGEIPFTVDYGDHKCEVYHIQTRDPLYCYPAAYYRDGIILDNCTLRDMEALWLAGDIPCYPYTFEAEQYIDAKYYDDLQAYYDLIEARKDLPPWDLGRAPRKPVPLSHDPDYWRGCGYPWPYDYICDCFPKDPTDYDALLDNMTDNGEEE